MLLLANLYIISSQCDLAIGPGQITGKVTATSCVEVLVADFSVGQCYLLCHYRIECHVAYTDTTNGVFRCVLCREVEAIDYTAAPEHFFLRGKVLFENHGAVSSEIVSLPGGLSVGQVIVVQFVMGSDRTFLLMVQTEDHYPFLVEFRISSSDIVRNAKFGSWGYEERSKPHFNFSAGQLVEIVYIVRHADYMVYIDRFPFFTFQHRTADLQSIQKFELTGTATNLKSIAITS
ncbi:hypothetical protein EGW08_015952 [Elysia chlorotica]|uniref:Galectin n=1 Tax=Elysia chlorotica TaxID=188477 RepID=A0A3S0ZDA4_ELYCH|nr:hypothetical protein EGW08_015952 [Elysia chlorotica]